MVKYRLSPTALNLFLDCPRCFWLDKNKRIRRPRGIFPSLPGGMDAVIKTYFDKYRLKGEMPPEIEGKLPGKLFGNFPLLEKWRDWRKTDLRCEDKALNASLSGALDDCLIEEDRYIPLDYKTRGYKLIEDPRRYYQTQLDCYCLILDSAGYKTKGLAYLAVYWPLEVSEGAMVKFHVEPLKIETNIDSAKTIFKNAVTALGKDIPPAAAKCEYCNLVTIREDESQRGSEGTIKDDLFS